MMKGIRLFIYFGRIFSTFETEDGPGCLINLAEDVLKVLIVIYIIYQYILLHVRKKINVLALVSGVY
jgi:hypothetical protein